MIYITVCHRPYLARFNEDFQRIMDVSRLFVFFNKNLLAQTPASEPATALSFSNQKVTGQNISLSPRLSIFFWARGRAAGLSRGIFLGAGRSTVSMHQFTAPRKDTLRISLARVAILSKRALCSKSRPPLRSRNPAITSAPH